MAQPLLKACWKKGIQLSLQGENLAFKAAPGAMTNDILQQIKTQKPALIELIKAQPDYFKARPLSANERALWFLYRLDSQSVAYNMAYAVKLRKTYSDSHIQAAFDSLAQVHPILTLHYGERDGEPLQWLDRQSQLQVTIDQQDGWTGAQVKQWIAKQADQVLAPDQGKTWTAALLRNHTQQGADHYLSIVVHHIAADFMSFELLRNDLLLLLEGKQPTTRHYPDHDYQTWTYAQSNRDIEADKQYWLASFDQTPQLQLPTDFAHSSEQQSAGKELQQTLSEALSSQIRQICQLQGVTPYVWWMAAFQWFMARLSGQEDFVIGTPSAGRLTPQDQELVGYLVNPIALRCQIDSTQSFNQWLNTVNKQTQQMLKHQAFPFSTLLDNLKIERVAGRSPLFQHMFTLNQLRPNPTAERIISQEIMAEQRGAAHELNLVVVDDKSTFTCKWRYNNSLYKEQTVQRIQVIFEYFVQQLLIKGDKQLQQLALGPTALSCHMAGKNLKPNANTAWQSFVDSAHKTPLAIAISYNGQRISYKDLLGSVEQQARVMAEQGFQAGNRIGIYLPRSPEQVIFMLASWRLGGSFVVLDTGWPLQRLDYIAQDAQLALIAAGNEQLDKVADYQWQSQITWLGSEQMIANNTEVSKALVQPQNEAYLIYTSGSTGTPKAVTISQQNLMYYTNNVLEELTLSEDASLAALSNHSADLGYTALFGALLSGRCLRLLDESLALDSHTLLAQLKAEPVDCLKIVPSHLHGLLQAENDPALLPQQALLCGGEAFTPQLLSYIRQQKPQLDIFNHYGPSETTIGVVLHKLDDSDIEEIPLGKPMANVEVKVVDSFGQIQVEGIPGELHIAGPTVSNGYLNRADLTQQKFYCEQDKTWYRSGDSVVMRDGQLHYIGRIDDQVKIRGYRVELGEIESALKQCIDDAVVINQPTDAGQNRLVAYVICDDKQQLAQAQQYLDTALPDYMQPSNWQTLDALPRLANGKINKKALPEPDDSTKGKAAESSSEPSTVEQTLLDIWQALLGKDNLTIDDDFFAIGGDSILGLQMAAKARAQKIVLTPAQLFKHKTIRALAQMVDAPQTATVSPHQTTLLDIVREVLNKPSIKAQDNFFEVGGDSILSLQVVARARSKGIQILPKDIFNHKTVEALVASLPEQQTMLVESSQTVTSVTKEAFDLTPIQQWLMQQPLENAAHWNQSILLHSKQDLNIDALREAVVQLLQHHATLRLAFSQNQGKWQQQYQDFNPQWQHQVVKTFDSEADEKHLEQLQSEFALDTAPLLRVVWFGKTKQLLLTAHHLIVDAVSWQIIVSDLLSVYEAKTQNKTVTLDPVPVEFNQWQQALAQFPAEKLKQQREYWQSQLMDSHILLNEHNTYGDSRHQLFTFDESITSALLNSANQAYNTRIQELLLTALVDTLAVWLGIEQLTVELEGHGREASIVSTQQNSLDLSRSTGWFTSRFPQKFSTYSDLSHAIINIKEQLRNIPDMGIGYGLLRYGSEQAADWGDCSLLSFNYLGQQKLPQDGPFTLTEGLCPGMRDKNNPRPHLIDVNAVVVEGTLQIDWCYPPHIAGFEGFEQVISDFAQNVFNIVRHCSNQANGRATAADFPRANIDDNAFVALLTELAN